MARFDSNVAIRIAADFVGLPAFKKADTAVDKLYKGTKKLGAAFGLTFSATAIARYGAASVRAFAAEEKQIAALTATVKSLGIGFTALQANDFIENLERTTGIVREELQPAFQRLITQTGSLTKAQKILTTAVKVSFSGLMSVEEAANALTQAYVGNVKGLKQFNLGLTNAELAAMSFDQVLAKVSGTYDKQFNEALDTTQVKIDKFNVALGNAKENIGSGLVDAFADFAGNGNVDLANAKIERFSESLADVIRNGNLLAIAEFFVNPFATLGRTALGMNKSSVSPNAGKGGGYLQYKAQQAKLAAAEAKALANAKKLEDAKLATLRKQTAEKAKQALLDKANALLAKAKSEFDLEGIQINAALMNKSLSAEEKRRLEIKQKIWEIEQAQLANNLSLLEMLMKQLEQLMKQKKEAEELAIIAASLRNIFDFIGTDKKLIDTLNLEQAKNLLTQMASIRFATVSGGSALAGTNFAGSSVYDLINYANDIRNVNPDMPLYYEGFSGYTGTDPNTAANIAGGDIYVTAIVEGNVMSQNDLATAIREQIQEAQQSGKDVNWARQALPATFL